MSLQQMIIFLLVGLAAGWLAARIIKGVRKQGILANLVTGVIGALLGGWLFAVLGIKLGAGILGSVITATIGAIVLLLLLRALKI